MGPTTTFKLSWEAGAAQTSSPSWQRLGLAGKFALLDQASAQSMTGSGPACRVGSNESVVTSLIHRALHLPVGATSLTFINTNTDKKKRIKIQIAVVTHGLEGSRWRVGQLVGKASSARPQYYPLLNNYQVEVSKCVELLQKEELTLGGRVCPGAGQGSLQAVPQAQAAPPLRSNNLFCTKPPALTRAVKRSPLLP